MAKIESPIDVVGNEQQVVVVPIPEVPNARAYSLDVVEINAAPHPQRFTLYEVFQMIKSLAWAQIVIDLLLRHRLSTVCFGLGLVIINIFEALQGYNLLQQLSIFGMGILVHVLVYKSIRPYLRFRPYERLINANIKFNLTPDKVVRFVNCINRWVVTLQFFLSGAELFDLFLITIALEVVQSIFLFMDTFLLIRIAFCAAYATPRLITFIEDLNPMTRACFQLKAKQFVLLMLGKLEEIGLEVKLNFIERWKAEVDVLTDYEYEYWRSHVQFYDVEFW